jgi:hypothetical protein
MALCVLNQKLCYTTDIFIIIGTLLHCAQYACSAIVLCSAICLSRRAIYLGAMAVK